jgi:hypothetical protein
MLSAHCVLISAAITEVFQQYTTIYRLGNRSFPAVHHNISAVVTEVLQQYTTIYRLL